MLKYRKIKAADDTAVAGIIRANLEKLHLDIPGTAYFDPQLDHMSAYYDAAPEKRAYFVALDETGRVIGGVGIAEFCRHPGLRGNPEALSGRFHKGKGYGRELMKLAEAEARKAGYKRLYLETHSNLTVAMKLYEKLGFRQIERPETVLHGTMDHFYLKEL